MLKFEKNTDISVAAGAEEALISKSRFACKLRQITVRHDGDDTTGQYGPSSLEITVDDTVILHETFSDLRGYWACNVSAASGPAMVLSPLYDDTTKQIGIILAMLDFEIFHSLIIKATNADPTNPADVYIGLVYEQPV